MSPADRWQIALISIVLVSLFLFALTYIPTYLYIPLIFGGTCVIYYHNLKDWSLLARLGLNPRCGVTLVAALKRWLAGVAGSVLFVPDLRRTDKNRERKSAATPGDLHFPSSVFRREPAFSDSVFSPRDFLMGSYLGKADRPGERDQLRERLRRPNHAAHTPNRRLSFGNSEPVGGRFTITPKRHYPLQQPGTSPVGVFPPAQWDGFHKKNILTQHNSPLYSPVTVKIARPDNKLSSPLFSQLTSPGPVASTVFEAQADPCSKESVLNMLRVSRKRDVDDEDRDFETKQKSKRRRNDSSGSSHSAFESLLANGAPSHLVPRPGSLKRGLHISVLEESTVKRSRTSSISSVTSGPVLCGVPGSVRNPISSSYSSQGNRKKSVGSSLHLLTSVSPGTSRCPTPEKASRKEENNASQSSASPVKYDEAATESVSGFEEHLTSETAVISRSDSTGNSSGKRRRKITLMSKCRGDQISLPPPPELAYKITVKDLDMEKRTTLSQIQKVLKEPEQEKPNPVSKATPSATISFLTQQAQSSVNASVSTAPSTLPTGLPHISTPHFTQSPAPTIDLTITPMASAISVPIISASNKATKLDPLPGVLSPPAATSTVLTTPVVAQPPVFSTSAGQILGAVKSETSLAGQPPKISTVPCTTTDFAQPSVNRCSGEGSLFNFDSVKPTSSASISHNNSNLASTSAVCTVANPSPSVFKPIFSTSGTAPVSTPGNNSVFGNAFRPTGTTLAPTPATQSSTAQFRASSIQPVSSSVSASGLTNSHSVTTSVSSILNNQTSIPSLFACPNSQTMVSSVLLASSNTQNSTNSLFGGNLPLAASIPLSTSIAQNSSPFSFGNKVNDSLHFGTTLSATASSATTNTSSNASNTNTTSQFAALKPPQTTPSTVHQNTFTFGQNSMSTPFTGFANNTTAASTPMTQTTFSSSLFTASTSAHVQSSAPSKPFTFGGTSAGTASVFGAPACTTEPLASSTQQAFGGASAGYFGNTNTSTLSASSAPTSTFPFGAAPPTPVNSAESRSFGFPKLKDSQFGSPAVQPSGFAFGIDNASNKPAFETSTPAFGALSGPIPFASPVTPVQGFGASAFNTPSPNFSIGAGSKQGNTRQRLQARRQHARKK